MRSVGWRVQPVRPASAADAFSLRGGPSEIAAQLVATLRGSPAEFDYVVLHPIPNPPTPDEGECSYMARVAREVLPRVRDALRGS